MPSRWTAGFPSPSACGSAPGPRSPDTSITDPRSVDDLSPFYVWTTDYAEKRLAWRRRHPLHVVLLRTYRIPRPVTVRVAMSTAAASWLEISAPLPFEGTPVLSDDEFDRATEEIGDRVERGPRVGLMRAGLRSARCSAAGSSPGALVAGAAASCQALCFVGGLTMERRSSSLPGSQPMAQVCGRAVSCSAAPAGPTTCGSPALRRGVAPPRRALLSTPTARSPPKRPAGSSYSELLDVGGDAAHGWAPGSVL